MKNKLTNIAKYENNEFYKVYNHMSGWRTIEDITKTGKEVEEGEEEDEEGDLRFRKSSLEMLFWMMFRKYVNLHQLNWLESKAMGQEKEVTIQIFQTIIKKE